MPGLFTTMFLVTAVASPPGVFAPYDADFKCSHRIGGDPDMPETVVVLDLELLEADPEGRRLERIDSLYKQKQISVAVIACWAWLEAHFGVEVRRGGYFMLTKEWMEQTRQDRVAALEALVSAQDRHWGDDRRIRGASRGPAGLRRPVRLRPSGPPATRAEQDRRWLAGAIGTGKGMVPATASPHGGGIPLLRLRGRGA